jgi:hypothetical protein
MEKIFTATRHWKIISAKYRLATLEEAETAKEPAIIENDCSKLDA